MWANKVKYSMLVVPVFMVFRMFQNKSIYDKLSILNKKYLDIIYIHISATFDIYYPPLMC